MPASKSFVTGFVFVIVAAIIIMIAGIGSASADSFYFGYTDPAGNHVGVGFDSQRPVYRERYYQPRPLYRERVYQPRNEGYYYGNPRPRPIYRERVYQPPRVRYYQQRRLSGRGEVVGAGQYCPFRLTYNQYSGRYHCVN